MIFQRLRIFVSSKMQELAPERQALKKALDDLKVDAWVFEQDAGARPESIQKAFLDEVEAADLYVGLFWKGYGDYTIEEYEYAQKLGKDCLIYEKRAALNGQRDPKLQAFLDRLGEVETGLTIKWFNEPAELTEAIKNDIQRLQARIYRERLKPRITVNLSLIEKKERDELLILLRNVKESWIAGVLEKSVHGQALIELGKEARPEYMARPWEQVLELPDQRSRTIQPNEPIGQIFDDVGRSLLILGAPGAGKTITLLTLARELVRRAEDDPAQPIPVVFNLSSWNEPRQNLLDWLIEELLVKYQVPRKIGRRWLEANWLVLLLDGLDEVTTANQAACVKAINTYAQTNGAPGLAVCSRLKEYTDLPVRLHVSGAVCLRPLTSEQVKAYVARSGDTLAGLRAALDKDRVLQSLAETPLMLDVMSLAYRDLPAKELTGEVLYTEQERRSHLFDTYIRKMFARKGKGTQEFGREQSLDWLTWLARGMQRHGQSVFLLEQLQPSWLSNRRQRMVYILISRMSFGVLYGLLLGLDFGLTSRALSRATFGFSSELSSGLILGVLVGLIAGVIDAIRGNTDAGWTRVVMPSSLRGQTITVVLIFPVVIGCLFFSLGWLPRETRGLFFASLLGLFWGFWARHHNISNDIKHMEILRWSFADARKGCAIGFFVGVVLTLFAFLFILLFGLTGDIQLGDQYRSDYTRVVIDSVVPIFGAALLYGLVGAVVGGLFAGLKGAILYARPKPNSGIKLSIRNAVVIAGLAASIFWIILAFIFALYLGLILGLGLAVGSALIFGATAFFWYGGQDVIQHYILRLMLCWKEHTPLRYANFLDYAARLVFLQKVGGGYIFIHRLLLEHFATMPMPSNEKQLAERGKANTTLQTATSG